MHPITIIGSGMAAYSVAREFRKLDKTTPIVFITADAGDFYSKPMLSNAFAQGKTSGDLISQTAVQMAAQIGATILTNTTVNYIDTHKKVAVTPNGEFEFSKLVIAVGAEPIRLAIAGNAAHRVLSVNHVSDYAVLRQQIDAVGTNARVTILGAGLIGCEFADDLSTGGHAVTLVDPNATALSALAPPAISQGLQIALQARGVTLKLGATAISIDSAIEGDSAIGSQNIAIRVGLSNSEVIETDVVLSAVGLRPNVRLAQASALTVDRGIIVDAFGQTSEQDVFAIGDCAQYTNSIDGSCRTLPYIAPILNAARAIAKTLSGTPTMIDLKLSPVIVKTPSFSIALIAPTPAQSSTGTWITEQIGDATVCRFFNAEGKTIGFALAPQEAKLRNSLMEELAL